MCYKYDKTANVILLQSSIIKMDQITRGSVNFGFWVSGWVSGSGFGLKKLYVLYIWGGAGGDARVVHMQKSL